MSNQKSEPMDPSAAETSGPLAEHVPVARMAYALKTLVREVLALFPETPHEYSEPNGRGTALAVTFDVSSLDLDDRDNFASLLSLAKVDSRVEEVIVDEAGAVCVRLVSNPRTQDDRETFDLDAIWADMGNEPNQHESWCDGTMGCGMAGCADSGVISDKAGTSFTDPEDLMVLTDEEKAALAENEGIAGIADAMGAEQ